MPEFCGEYVYTQANEGCASDYLRPIVRHYVAAVPAGGIVLDAGCGNGSMLASFRGQGLRLVGLEISRSGLQIAAESYPELEFRAGDLSSELYDDPLFGRCDLVISTEVVEHVVLPRILVKNCYSFLRPGGRLVISTPYHGYAKNLLLAATGKLDAHFAALWDYGHIKFWSRRTLGQLLREAGFCVEEFRGAGRLPYVWKSMVMIASKPVDAV